MKIAFLGCGSMGEAIMAGLLSSGVSPRSVVATTRTPGRAARLRQVHGVEVVSTAESSRANQEAVREATIVVLGTKPYGIAALAREVAGSLDPGAIVITIAAATSLEHVQWELPASQPLVRAMPNTPLKVGRGVVGITGGEYATAEHVARAVAVFDTSGVVVEIPEALQDAVSAISGSGPAYFFYLAEAMIEAARNLGLDGEMARRLVRQTLIGAGALLEQEESDPRELRRAVSSPNGTTESAIATFERSGFVEMIDNGVRAATLRAAEMAKEL